MMRSSMQSVNSAHKIWSTVAREYGWDDIIFTDDLQRGAKMATFVVKMIMDTELVYASIKNYEWGIRQYMILHHQDDPIMGVANWGGLMRSAAVLTNVPHEPRKALPMESLGRILADTDRSSFEEVQHSFFLNVLYFTFSRTECPCPKTFDGFDENIHWQVRQNRFFGKCVS